MKKDFGVSTDPKKTNYHKPPGAKSKHRWALILLSLVVVLIAGIVAWKLLLAPNRSGEKVPVFVVKRGPLTISITESGTIKSRDRVMVKSEVEGRAAILWLIDEGTDVQKGDLLVQLDSSSMEDRKVQQQTSRLNAEAAFIRSRENLAVIKSQGESDIAKAELTYKFSKLDLNKYLKGEYPQELDQAEAQITIAKEELSRAEQKLKWSVTLAEEGYITDTELQADELASKRSELDVELAQGKLRVLQEYSHPRTEEQLSSDIIQAEQALERVRRRAEADNIQAEADLKAKEAEFHRKEDILDKTVKQIAKCRITAPVAGMAIYSTTGKGSWRGNVEPLAEGQDVRERQELIYLPTTSSMMAEIKIHESSLRKVRTGMRTLISCDALPGKVFTGTVGKIALLPDAQSVWLNPDLKVFPTEIYLDGNGEEIRPGMTCQAEIIVQGTFVTYDDGVFEAAPFYQSGLLQPLDVVQETVGAGRRYLPREHQRVYFEGAELRAERGVVVFYRI